MSFTHRIVKTPIGRLKVIADDQGVVAILWKNDSERRVRLAPSRPHSKHAVLDKAEKQLHEYFNGKRKKFTVPLSLQHGTAFQRKVWTALRDIPFGETRSYSELAKAIGSPKAVRAVGAANGKNPLSIIVPCHRVIGSNGKLTGFAGGIPAKETLLNLENRK